jgi:hypothetical protein
VARIPTDNSRATTAMAYFNVGDNVMRTFVIALLFTILAWGSRPATATDCTGGTACCDQCGRHVPCVEKTCQVVCEIKLETKTCWCVECQEICPLMPGCRHGCCECPPPPRCGHPKCVKKLVKKEYQVEVPVYKCVVRHLCSECLRGEPAAIPSGAPQPPAAPAVPAMPPAPPSPTPPSRVQG